MTKPTKILYCRCAYAKVVPADVKQAVLQQLSDSDVSFEAVADLCELSAKKELPSGLVTEGEVLKIAACYPRAVKWLFNAGEQPLPEDGVEILNMRTASADVIVERLLSPNVEQTSNE